MIHIAHWQSICMSSVYIDNIKQIIINATNETIILTSLKRKTYIYDNYISNDKVIYFMIRINSVLS